MRAPITGELFLGSLADGNFKSVRSMSASESQEVYGAHATLRAFHRESQSYEHIKRDYDDLRQYAAGILRIISEHGTSPDISLDFEVELNRRVMALLNSFRAFLDHTAHALSRAFGSDSQELRDFRTACSTEYDAHFAYRFSSKLRNYSQHFDLPIGYLSLRGQGQRRQHQAEVSLLCIRDQLLASGFDWGRLLAELQGRPESWNIHTTIDELMPCIERIRPTAIKPHLRNVIAAATKVAALALETGYPDAQPVVIRILEPVDGKEHIQVTLAPHYHATEILRQYAATKEA